VTVGKTLSTDGRLASNASLGATFGLLQPIT